MRQVLSAAKRQSRLLLEWALDVRIVRPHMIGLLFEQEHLRRVFQAFKIDCVFDVGANKGQYADMIRTTVGYAGPIVSFEPTPEAAQALRRKASGDEQWLVEPMALDETAGTKSFNVAADSEFSSFHAASAVGRTEFDRKIATAQVISVQASTLQLEFDKYQGRLQFKRPFLKMDTQGHDIAVAAGAGDRLGQFVGLQSELSVVQLYEDMPNFIRALSFFQDRGFYLSALVPNNTGHFPHLLEIDCIMLSVKAALML